MNSQHNTGHREFEVERRDVETRRSVRARAAGDGSYIDDRTSAELERELK